MSLKCFHYLLLFLTISSAETRIAITEILKNPKGLESAIPGGESHEFIEIFNLGSDTLTLDSLFLSDGSTIDSIIPWQTPLSWHTNCIFNRTVILPGQSALILDRDYAKSPMADIFTIADSTVILTVDASSLVGKLTETRGVFLYKGTGSTIHDSLAALLDSGYTATLGSKAIHTLPKNCAEGFSCIPVTLISAPPSYTASPDTLSPGYYEFMKQGWVADYRLNNPGSASPIVVCTLAVLQAGKDASQNASWTVTKTGSSEAIASGTLPNTPYPVYITVNLPKDSVGYLFSVEESGNKAEIVIDISSVWLPDSPIKINEIFPRATAAVPEWIELINVSAMPVNLKNWRYGTPEGSDNIITTTDYTLEPGHFCVITKSAEEFSIVYSVGINFIQPISWQSLDNYRDTLVLISTLEEAPCESIYYDYDWFDSWDYQSVARISVGKSGLEESAWTLAQKPTPGLPNPEVNWQSQKKADLHIGPIPFTPNHDGKNDSLSIRIILPASQKMSITIYGFNGRKLYDLPVTTQETFTWNGRTSDGRHAPVGPFFVVATVTKGNTETLIRKKGILWR